METGEVPVGTLVDFGTEPPSSPPLEAVPATLRDGDGSLGDGASESEATESADSENDMGESPSHPSWDQDRRSSSSESFSSSQSTESAQDEETLLLREFMRGYVEKIFSGGYGCPCPRASEGHRCGFHPAGLHRQSLKDLLARHGGTHP